MKNVFFDKIFNVKFLYVLCTLAGTLYCLGLTFYPATFIQNFLTILFILFLFFLFSLNFKIIISANKVSIIPIFIQLALLNMSIAIMGQAINSPPQFFWVDDSIKTHLIDALKFASFFQGNPADPEMGIHYGFSTHSLTGLFISFLGKTFIATVLAQLIFKLIALYFIYKIAEYFWSEKIASLAMLLYGLCPTIFFYNIVLYKESAVQAYFAALTYFTLKVFDNKKFYFVFPLVLAFYGLLRERFYISYLFIITITLCALMTPTKKSVRNITLLLIATAAGIFWFYKHQSLAIQTLPAKLEHYRSLHANFGDVLNKFNYDIPYILAFVKILFSPYLTPNKFRIFTDLSTLLIWGSFINQIIILASALGFFSLIRKRILHLFLWIPFILFLLLAAYISPWSGRLRDSFYPLIACYAAYYLYNNKYFKKLFRIKDDYSEQP